MDAFSEFAIEAVGLLGCVRKVRHLACPVSRNVMSYAAVSTTVSSANVIQIIIRDRLNSLVLVVESIVTSVPIPILY